MEDGHLPEHELAVSLPAGRSLELFAMLLEPHRVVARGEPRQGELGEVEGLCRRTPARSASQDSGGLPRLSGEIKGAPERPEVKRTTGRRCDAAGDPQMLHCLLGGADTETRSRSVLPGHVGQNAGFDHLLGNGAGVFESTRLHVRQVELAQ